MSGFTSKQAKLNHWHPFGKKNMTPSMNGSAHHCFSDGCPWQAKKRSICWGGRGAGLAAGLSGPWTSKALSFPTKALSSSSSQLEGGTTLSLLPSDRRPAFWGGPMDGDSLTVGGRQSDGSKNPHTPEQSRRPARTMLWWTVEKTDSEETSTRAEVVLGGSSGFAPRVDWMASG